MPSLDEAFQESNKYRILDVGKTAEAKANFSEGYLSLYRQVVSLIAGSEAVQDKEKLLAEIKEFL